MAIKKFYSAKSKAGWRWDSSTEKFWSWGFDIWLESGRRKRESGFGTRQLAENAAARIRLAEKNSRYELTDARKFPTVCELFQKRIEAIGEHAEKTRAVRVLNALLDCLTEKGFSDLRINQLTTSQINFYVEHRQKENVKDETINRDLRTVRATLNQAKNLFADIENYAAPKVRFLKVDKSRRERIVHSLEAKAILFYLLKPQTEEESEKLFLSRRRAGFLFLLSAVTGARPGELVALKESDILEDLQVLKIVGRKTRFRTAKTVRYFPLIEIVRRLLFEAVAIKAGEFIFSQKGTLTATYYEQIKTACESAGIVYGRKIAGGFIPYDLRHTATTLIMQSGTDFETASSITGQSRHTLWYYTHASNESINRAVSILENFARQCLENSDNGLGLDKKEKPKALKAA
ncbi:MAG: tyrosine-type recombinase/integrase [Acidobacteria bacterium]|jgi:integrase|nr:tyrosine-type recombinase/integrase [Acidobacteriota bacterium]